MISEHAKCDHPRYKATLIPALVLASFPTRTQHCQVTIRLWVTPKASELAKALVLFSICCGWLCGLLAVGTEMCWRAVSSSSWLHCSVGCRATQKTCADQEQWKGLCTTSLLPHEARVTLKLPHLYWHWGQPQAHAQVQMQLTIAMGSLYLAGAAVPRALGRICVGTESESHMCVILSGCTTRPELPFVR
jgi:hypothetical protein